VPADGCCVALRMHEHPDKLQTLLTEFGTSKKSEHQRLLKSVKVILKEEKVVKIPLCRGLGDVAIVYLAPEDATILTTNTSDFDRLAYSWGRQVRNPLRADVPAESESEPT